MQSEFGKIRSVYITGHKMAPIISRDQIVMSQLSLHGPKLKRQKISPDIYSTYNKSDLKTVYTGFATRSDICISMIVHIRKWRCSRRLLILSHCIIA